MRITGILLFLLWIGNLNLLAQKEWVNWVGMPGGISFKNGFPEAFNTLTNYSDFWKFQGGNTVTYSDPATGQIQFVATHRSVFNKNYDTVKNGYGLIGCDGYRYGVQVVPFPNSENKFYIFHSFPETSLLSASETGLQTRCFVYAYINRITGGLRYSILDMDKNNGLGEIISENNLLQSQVLQRIALVKHANGKDVWLISHGWGTNIFTCFLINKNGIQPPVTNNIGPVFSGKSSRCSGEIDASPDGSKLAATSGSSDVLELYDFNNATGIISNYKEVKVPGQPNSVCFSPDNSKLYIGSTEVITCGYRYKIYQVDFYEADMQKSLFKVYESGGSETVFTEMERAADNKIYVGGRVVYNPTGSNSIYLYSIDYPNQPKNACTFTQNSFLSSTLIPFANLINDQVKQEKEAQILNFNFPKETTVCFGTYTLTAPSGYEEYHWSNGATTPSITVNEPGLYSVLAGAKDFKKPQAYGYTLVHSAGKALNFGKDTAVCPKTEFVLTIPYSYTNILWQDGDTSHIHKVTQRSGKQRVTTSDPNGCQTWDSICVSYKYYPRAEFGKDTTLCAGQNLTLRLEPSTIFVTNPVKYTWQDGSAKETVTVTKPGTYWGKVTHDGCTVADTISVSYIDAQKLNIGTDTALCKGDTLQLRAPITNALYQWSTGETSQTITVHNSGNYWLRVNNGSCTVTDTIHITFNEPPVVNLGNDTILCANEKLTRRSNVSDARFLWQDGSVKDFFEITSAGTYWLQVNKNGCTVRDTINVSYKPSLTIDLGNDTTLCDNSPLSLNARHPSVVSYGWQDGSVQSSYIVRKAGTYWVKVKDNNGCYNADTIKVDIQPLPQFTLGRDTTLCDGQSFPVQFNLTNATYLWNTGSSSNTATIKKPGIYWLDVTQKGCTKRDSIAVSFKSLPDVSLGKDTTLCEGTTKLLNVFNDNATYLWNNGSQAPAYTVSAPGTFQVHVTMNGCTKSDTISVNYHYKPRFTLGKDTILCLGQQLILNPHVANSNYVWQDGSQNNTYTATQSGIYSVTISNTCGSNSDEIVISKGLCQLLMPNAFTPNGDGNNDLFRVKYPQFLNTFQMTIYNRWGEVIFQTTDPTQGWDGTYRGRLQTHDNYIWIISYTDIEGNSGTQKGNVVLLR